MKYLLLCLCGLCSAICYGEDPEIEDIEEMEEEIIVPQPWGLPGD